MEPHEWEAHYRGADTPWDHGEAAPGLVDFLASHRELPRGRVVCPGCGFGHDVRAWAAAGFTAEGVDLSPTAVAAAERLTPSPLTATFRARDFLRGDPGRSYDGLFEHTLYCAIEPADREAYAEAVARWVAPGGWFLAVHYLRPDGPSQPPYPCDREELLSRFSRHFELLEDWNPRSWPQREGKEWMFWWRRKS